jgi:outer membrane protein OmpA-like peptidoglycan-associated protein
MNPTKTTGFLVAAMLLAATVAWAQPVLTPQRNLVPQPLPAAPAPSPQPAAAAAPAPAPTPAPPPTPIPFEEAVLRAANDLLSKAALPERGPGDKVVLAIDPLVDGVTGMQSAATRSMEQRIVALVRERYPQFDVQQFNTATMAKLPIVLIGTFTPINNAGQAGGPKDVYRVCLALADLKARRIIGKGVARSRLEGVDSTPTPFFVESPVWIKDPSVDAYVKSCQGTKPGDPVDQVYADRILAAAFLADAINAYDARHYGDALKLYEIALRTPGGDQLRAFNGLYLTHAKLGHREAATDAFGKVVDFGLQNNRLAVKFLFRPGSTVFWPDRRITAAYPMWINQIARHTARSTSCLEIVGHTTARGSAALNERLSVQRAESMKRRLSARAPLLASRITTSGMGPRENLVGTAKDNAGDALDRRVEFKVRTACS